MINRDWKRAVLSAPGIGLSLLPKVACPACWPAYAGLLSSVGLGFLVPNVRYLLPMTAMFLLIALGALAFRGQQRHGFWPLAVGTLAAILIMLGKFSFASNPVFYAGLGLLVLASVWNSWRVAPYCHCTPAAGSFNNQECSRRNEND